MQEGQSGLLTGFASFCQMVSFLFGFRALFSPLSESRLGLMSAVSAGGSTEGKEQRESILSVWENKRKMQKNQRVVWVLGPSLRAGGTWFPPLSPSLAAAALPTPRQGWELLWCDYKKRKKDATSSLKIKKSFLFNSWRLPQSSKMPCCPREGVGCFPLQIREAFLGRWSHVRVQDGRWAGSSYMSTQQATGFKSAHAAPASLPQTDITLRIPVVFSPSLRITQLDQLDRAEP